MAETVSRFKGTLWKGNTGKIKREARRELSKKKKSETWGHNKKPDGRKLKIVAPSSKARAGGNRSNDRDQQGEEIMLATRRDQGGMKKGQVNPFMTVWRKRNNLTSVAKDKRVNLREKRKKARADKRSTRKRREKFGRALGVGAGGDQACNNTDVEAKKKNRPRRTGRGKIRENAWRKGSQKRVD